jgi:hypothetical protein
MNKLLMITLLVVACGREQDTQPAYYRHISLATQPNKVVWDISEMPVCINQCDILLVRNIGRFYCEGSVRWIPLTQPVICQMN